MDIPTSFLCCITKELMINPVIDKDGHSYEKDAIEKWLDNNTTSPITRNVLLPTDLTPNRNLKDSIKQYMIDNNIEQSTSIDYNVPLPKYLWNGEDVNTDIMIFKDNNTVTLQVPDISVRPGFHICCVIDKSYSMDENIPIGSEGYITKLDIVKHSVKTILYSMTSFDSLSIVSFSDTITVECENITMNSEGKRKVNELVDAIKTDGATNIYSGLKRGLDILQNETNKNSSLFLLTDGQPTTSPPRGHLHALTQYKEQNGIPCTIHTFGFGYNIDSDLLCELAHYGKGRFSFIPDSSLVGTIFVNAISNIYSTFATDVTIDITNGSETSKIYINDLTSGQDRHLHVPMSLENSTVSLTYTDVFSKVQTNSNTCIERRNEEIEDHAYIRFNLDNLLRSEIAHNNNEESLKKLQTAVTHWKTLSCTNEINDLLRDVEGQVYEAFSRKDWFNRWGKYYISSLIDAHNDEICNNFKDPGVQHYGGTLFNSQRDQLDELFLAIPPPKVRTNNGSTNSGQVNMTQFYNSNNPCFKGTCIARMVNGGTKLVKYIRKGDIVDTPSGPSRVVCVIKTKCENNKEYLVSLPSGLVITPYHPIFYNNKWEFPCNIGTTKLIGCDAVYSFVLDNRDSMYINEVLCATLGHNKKGAVIEHPYFGSDAIINDLKQKPSYYSGVVELRSGSLERDQTTNMIVGLL